MELIDKNPYRILGVFSNASLKEITANKTKLARYASVGKSVSFDADMDGVLPPVTRTAESVEKAFADLSLPQDKLKYALFWFVKDTNFDELALGHLNAGNSDKAAELFGKRECWSGLMNSGVLAMAHGDLSTAIGYITKVIHTSDYRTALVKAVSSDTYQIEEIHHQLHAEVQLYLHFRLPHSGMRRYLRSGIRLHPGRRHGIHPHR